MKNKNDHKKSVALPILLVFVVSFCCLGYFYQYLFTTAFINPYANILLLFAIAIIAFISLVPTLLIYYSFIHRKFLEFSLLFFGSFFGLILIYAIEFITRDHPVMRLYVSLHNSLFDMYKINIYFLDYGGFGFLLAGFSAATFGLLSVLVYLISNRCRI